MMEVYLFLGVLSPSKSLIGTAPKRDVDRFKSESQLMQPVDIKYILQILSTLIINGLIITPPQL
jgi:hypothetical protein